MYLLPSERVCFRLPSMLGFQDSLHYIAMKRFKLKRRGGGRGGGRGGERGVMGELQPYNL